MPRNRLAPPWLLQSGARLQRRIDANPILAAALPHTGAIIVVASFLVVSMALYVMGDGIPYVMDNNETFSSLNHAHNLWNFDFFRSFGLADEAASPDAAAHPVVHSHQGNFPRLFAFLIYVLGARSAESQILVTTLTIGVASVLMAYAFFRRLVGPLFATVTLLVFTTDYLMFAQWQVNTYRVWHTFFLFGALLCVHGYAEWRPRNWALATFLLYLGLFYWELVFAVFTALTAGFYTLWVYRSRWRAIIVCGGVQGAGAVCGLAIVITQLVLYLGWDGFVQDLTLTLTARNYAPDDAAFLQTLKDFYGSRNIAFFYNLQASGSHLSVAQVVRSFAFNVAQVPTPLFSLLAVTLAAAMFAADSRLPGPSDARAISPVTALATELCLVVGAFAFLLSLADDGSGAVGMTWSGLRWGFGPTLLLGLVCLLLTLGTSICLLTTAQWISISGAPPSLARGIRAGLFLLAVGLLIGIQSNLYGRAGVALWVENFTLLRGGWAKASVFATVCVGALIILAGRRATLGIWHAVQTSIAPFLLCGALGYLIVYRLSAGYLHSGYLYRLCPLPVFFYDVLLALGVFGALAMALTLASRSAEQLNGYKLFIAGAGSAAVCMLVVGLWISVQLGLINRLPPDQFAFVKRLEPGLLDGEGILSNTYATPFGAVGRTWAYMRAPDRHTASVPSDPKIAADNSYVWLADRHSNSRYWRPEIYVCFFQAATMRALLRQLEGDIVDKCSQLDIVRRALYELGPGTDPKPELVARDNLKDHWAILKLIWSPAAESPIPAVPHGRHE